MKLETPWLVEREGQALPEGRTGPFWFCTEWVRRRYDLDGVRRFKVMLSTRAVRGAASWRCVYATSGLWGLAEAAGFPTDVDVWWWVEVDNG
jgi:hypothetical protein